MVVDYSVIVEVEGVKLLQSPVLCHFSTIYNCHMMAMPWTKVLLPLCCSQKEFRYIAFRCDELVTFGSHTKSFDIH